MLYTVMRPSRLAPNAVFTRYRAPTKSPKTAEKLARAVNGYAVELNSRVKLFDYFTNLVEGNLL